MKDTLASLYQAFVEHRQQHRRGAYPLRLRRRAVEALSQDERFELAARIGLTAEQVSRWNRLSAPRPGPSQFIEVPAQAVASPPPAGLRVEVELRSGAVLRLRGELDVKGLRMLVAALDVRGAAQ